MSEIYDLAIVGSGFMGLSGAVSFAHEEAQSSVIVITDQTHITSGSASASTGGHILPGFELPAADLLERYAPDRARHLFDFTVHGVRYLISTSAHATLLKTVIGMTDPSESDQLDREIAALANLDHGVTPLDLTSVRQIGLGGCVGGYVDPVTGFLRGEARIAELLEQAQTAGVQFIEDAATAIDMSGDSIGIQTSTGTISAQRILVAAGSSVPRLLQIPDPIWTQTTTSFRFDAPDDIPDMAACQSGALPEYYWVSGGKVRFGIRADPAPSVDTARACFARRFGKQPGRWRGTESGQIVQRESLMPHVLHTDRCFAAYGFGGHGVVLSNWLGHLAGRALSGNQPAGHRLSGFVDALTQS